MPIISTLKDIDEAIDNLGYKNETTLKYKLIRAVRKYYSDDSSFESLKSIDTEDLVREVWETGDDAELLKAKRKNFSSIKSSVNSDLKKLYQENKNPQGIIIGHNNLFDISDDAKNKALASISEIFREKGIDTSSRLTEILATLSEVLSTAATSATSAGNTKEEIERLKEIIGGLSGKLGFSLHDLAGANEAEAGHKAGQRKAAPELADDEHYDKREGSLGIGKAEAVPSESGTGDKAGIGGAGKGMTEAGYGDDDKAGRDHGHAESDTAEGFGNQDVKGTGGTEGGSGLPALFAGKSLAAITEILRKDGTDAKSKINNIMGILNGVLSEAISAAGNDLNPEERAQIKHLFGELTAAKNLATGDADGIGDKIGSAGGKDERGLTGGSLEKEGMGSEEIDSPGSGLNSFEGITAILCEQGIDAHGKAAKIMALVNCILSDAVDSTETGLNGDEATQIKNILGNIATGIQSYLPGGADTEGKGAGRGLMTQAVTDNTDSGVSDASGDNKAIGFIEPSVEKEETFEKDTSSNQPGSGKGAELAGIIEILQDNLASPVEKAGKIMVQMQQLLSQAISSACSEFSSEEAARIKQLFAGIGGKAISDTNSGNETGQADAVHGVTDTGQDGNGKEGSGRGQADTGADKGFGGQGQEGIGTDRGGEGLSDDLMRRSIAGITDILREQDIGTESRISRIMTVANNILSDAIAAAGDGLDSRTVDEIKNIFADLALKTGLLKQEGGPGGETATEIGDGDKTGKGDGEGESDSSGNLNSIMNSIGELLSSAMPATGLNMETAETARIKQLFTDLAGQTGLLLKYGKESGKSAASGDGVEPGIGIGDAELQGAGDKTSGGGNIETGFIGTGQGVEAHSEAGGEHNSPGIGNEDGGELTGAISSTNEADAKLVDQPENIKTTINNILSSLTAATGGVMKPEEMDRIKNLFGSLSAEVDSLLEAGGGDGDGTTGGYGEDVIYEIVEDEEESPEEIVEVVEEIVTDEMAGAGSSSGEITEEDATIFAQATGQGNSPFGSGNEAGASGGTIGTDEITEFVDETAGTDSQSQAAISGGEADEKPGLGAGEDIGIGEGNGAIADRGARLPHPKQEGEDTYDYDFEEVLVADDFAFAKELAEQEGINSTGQNYGVDGTGGTGDSKSAIASEYEDIEIVEEFIGDEVEEVIEEQVGAGTGQDGSAAVPGATGDGPIDEDLRTKTDILAELAAAAKALERMGPDLNSSIYSEEEIKGKAKLLSEEFDRYLTVREKFYNQHILIRGGDYLVGKANRQKDELPEQLVKLREFYIGKFPVTNALFEIFVEKTGYITTAERCGFGMVYIPRMQRAKNPLTGTESFSLNRQLQYNKVPGACWHHPAGPTSSLYVKRTHPVVQVSLEDACAFAAWTGKRIPTEKEWEASARTFRSYIYPWGNDWRDNACNLEASMLGDTSPVDQYVKFCNEFEVADTLGNILEWTLDFWKEQAQEADADDEDIYVVKGASWISESPVSLTDRQPMYKNTSSNILGFRCIAI